MQQQSGSSSEVVVQAASEAAEGAERAVECAQTAAEAADRAADTAEAAVEILHKAMKKVPEHLTTKKVAQGPMNPWNRFQQLNAGKGWLQEKMRAEYYRAKCHTNV